METVASGVIQDDEITEEKVDTLYLLCLSKGEPKKKTKKVTCFKTDVVFDRRTLTEYKEEIVEMLNNLSAHFKDGASFIWACVDKHGRTWTTDETIMQELFLLGLAVGKVTLFNRRTSEKKYETLPWFIIS